MFRKLSLALVALSLTAFTEPGRVPASEQALQEQQARISALEAEGKRLQLEAEQQVNKGSAQVLEARMLLGQAQAIIILLAGRPPRSHRSFGRPPIK